MKRYAAVVAVIALSMFAVPASWGQSGGMGGMDMKGMDMKEKDTTGKDKKGKAPEKPAQAKVHKGVGTVKSVDKANGKVTISHGPIKTMKWSAMTMAFGVKDNALLEKLSTGKKVGFEFVQQGSDYVITRIK